MDIAIAPGDGIGPELMAAVVGILQAAQVPLSFVPVEMGRAVWERGVSGGITDDAKATIARCGVLLKGPLATPTDGGAQSIDLTVRKTWSTFANKRIFRSLRGVPGLRRYDIDVTMIRENIEDTYGGIEHMQTHDVAQCRRIITRPGCEQLHRYAFEVAQRKGARRITCGHKANIMKLTDGLFLDAFYQVAKEYPDLQADDLAIDAMAMQLVMSPHTFDVVVVPNLQGDILSDLCAGLVGGLAYAPAANVGEHLAVFEAVRNPAHDALRHDAENPAGLLLAACVMLRHLGLVAHAARIDAALQRALFEAYRQPDLGEPPRPITTARMTALVLAELEGTAVPDERLDQLDLRPVTRDASKLMVTPRTQREEVFGVDLFIDSDQAPDLVAALVQAKAPAPLRVVMVSNRGTQVWPSGSVFTDRVNHQRVRVESPSPVDTATLMRFAADVADELRVCSLETLLRFDGAPGYAAAYGQ